MDAHKLWMLRDFIGTNKVLLLDWIKKLDENTRRITIDRG